MANDSILIEKNGDKFKVTIIGNINEDTDFKVHPLEGAATIEFQLGKVSGINSCGVREWIVWISKAANASMTLIDCPKVIIDQINMVQGFLPARAQVQSFYVPYFSDPTGEEKDVLFTLGKEFSTTGVTAPNNVTDSKGNPMEMDVVEAKYFKFIKK